MTASALFVIKRGSFPIIRNVLVTAGGTSEPIDAMRIITNKSTGKLGSLIAEAFAADETTEHIYYIHGQGAIMPHSDKIIPIPIESVDDLVIAIQALLRDISIDAIVHAMAVSDYRVKSVMSAETVIQAAQRKTDMAAFTESLLKSDIRSKSKKLSSDMESPVLLLERTPKVLPLLREWLPEAVIVGFKLLSHVPEKELINTAYRLLVKNGCDYVLANDYATVSAGAHKGYLINADRLILPCSGKEDIAKTIAAKVLGREDL